MLYHVIHLQTRELNTLTAKDILEMHYDAEGRVIITSNEHQDYFLVASKDLVSE